MSARRTMVLGGETVEYEIRKPSPHAAATGLAITRLTALRHACNPDRSAEVRRHALRRSREYTVALERYAAQGVLPDDGQVLRAHGWGRT